MQIISWYGKRIWEEDVQGHFESTNWISIWEKVRYRRWKEAKNQKESDIGRKGSPPMVKYKRR